jgi:hypothetical protein
MLSDMTSVERRAFQRNPAEWLNRAEAGEEIVIQSRGRAPLTLRLGKPQVLPAPVRGDWVEHFRWVRSRAPVGAAEFRESTRRDR